MSDYTNIQRVIIRKPTSIRELSKAKELLERAKRELDATAVASKSMIIPESVTNYKMRQIDMFISEAVRLNGFDSVDDMRYFVEHFINL